MPHGAGTPKPAFALAGTRAPWTSLQGAIAGIRALDVRVWGTAETDRPVHGQERRSRRLFLGGVAGGGPTLLHGRTAEGCDLWPPALARGSRTRRRCDSHRSVRAVHLQRHSRPVMLAFAGHDPQSGQIPKSGPHRPGGSPLLSDLGDAPRVAENGSVQVYRFLNRPVLLSSVAPRGTVKAIALSFPRWPCSPSEPTGRRRSSATTLDRGSSSARRLSRRRRPRGHISIAGSLPIGSKIYLLAGGLRSSSGRQPGRRLGLSSRASGSLGGEHKGRGRIVALTLR